MRIVKTGCDFCGHSRCSIRVYIDGNRIVKVEGDPDDPFTQGSLCPQGIAAGDIVHSPDRLQQPLIRVEGKDEWVATTWDNALTTIASKLAMLKEAYGPQSVVFVTGYMRTYFRTFTPLLAKFASLYGSSNQAGMGHMCAQPRQIGMKSVFGEIDTWDSADYEHSHCIILWGLNPNHFPPKARRIGNMVKKGCKLIVIDPKTTPFAKTAGLCLQPRPGTDGALALAMMNVIIDEKLYDEAFVDKWTLGFGQLKVLAKAYAPSRVAEITWVPADRIVEAARLYATEKPSSIDFGNSFDQHTNNFQTIRAVACLMAITGNLDVPGGNLLEPFDLSPPPKSSETSMKPLGTDLFPLTSRAHLPTVWKTIVSGEPYKVAGMLIFGGNPADTDVNSKFVREALSKLEFLVVVDFFMTATATFADVVLPAANFLESEFYTQGNRVVEPPGQAWSDHRILLELGRKMGYGEALEVVQRRFDAERKTASSERTPRAYRKYVHTGFHTPSGKVELYSERLQAQGFNPLPDYVEPHYSPLNSTISDKYPLVLTVGAKLPMYTHSQFRNIPRLRQLMPHNMFLVNEKTADKYNLKNGERVIVETESGRLEGPLEVASDLLDDVVQTFHGFDEMNANILTSNKSFDYATGSPGSKSMMCRIMKANSLL